MKNLVGAFCVGFGFCWGVLVAGAGAIVLARATGILIGWLP